MATVNIGRLKFKWQGNYSSGTAYVVDDVVYLTSTGSSYVCINDSTGNAPTNTSYWQKMAQGSDLGSLSGITQGDVVYYNGTDWTRLAAGTSGQFLKTNGSGANPVWDDVDLGTAAALDVGTGANNIVQLDSSGNLPAVDGSSLTGVGKVLQVVHANSTSKITASTQTWTTAVSASITPSSTSSKILILGTVTLSQTGGNVLGTRFLRNSTVVGSLTGQAQYLSTSNSGSWWLKSLSNNYLDSPNTTSSITYYAQGFGHEGTLNINSSNGDNMSYTTGDSDGTSNITLIEIGA